MSIRPNRLLSSVPAEVSIFGTGVHFAAGDTTTPVTVAERDDLTSHRRRFGATATALRDAAALMGALERAALTGRGGGHFPVAAKWRAAARGGTTRVVANGAESEPLSRKDAALLQLRPHLVLDGLARAVETLGAREGIVWLHDDATESRAAVEVALRERAAADLREPLMRVAVGPRRYVAGESSAVAEGVQGRVAIPVFRRQRDTTTVVHNVETLAHVALLARFGPDYRPPTLLTISDAHLLTVVEVDTEVLLAEVVDALGRSVRPAPDDAVLVGGYGGAWARWGELRRLLACQDDFAAAGLALGPGILRVLRRDECGVSLTAAIARFMAAESARQCGPCMFGLPAVADLVTSVAEGRARPRVLGRLRKYLGEVDGRGGCHHPDGAVRMISTALDVFGKEFDAHARRRDCTASAHRSP